MAVQYWNSNYLKQVEKERRLIAPTLSVPSQSSRRRSDPEKIQDLIDCILISEISPENSTSEICLQRIRDTLISQKIDPARSRIKSLWQRYFELRAQSESSPILSAWFIHLARKEAISDKTNTDVERQIADLISNSPISDLAKRRHSGADLEVLHDAKMSHDSTEVAWTTAKILSQISIAANDVDANRFKDESYLLRLVTKGFSYRFKDSGLSASVGVFSRLLKKSRYTIVDLEDLGRSINHVFCDPESSHETRMLALYAAYLRLANLKQPQLRGHLVDLYRKYSLALSEGCTSDCLGLFDSYGEQKTGMLGIRTWHNRPNTPSATAFTFGFLSTLGKHRLLHLIGARKRLDFKPADIKSLGSTLIKYAECMRGPAQKAVQFLAWTSADGISDNHWEQNLTSLKPIPFGEMLRERIHNLPQQLLHIEKDPIALGSVSQVYRGIYARSADNTVSCAVKITYPWLKERIDQDERSLRLILPFLGGYLQNLDLKALWTEANQLLRAESDLSQEADHLRYANRMCQDLPGVRVPEVLFADEHVLIQEYIAGEKLRDFAQRCQDETVKQTIAKNLFRFITRSILSGRFNTDPSPENFLIRNETVYAIDWGSTKICTPKSKRINLSLLQFALDPSLEQFKDLLREAEIVGSRKRFDFEDAYKHLLKFTFTNYGSDQPDVDARAMSRELAIMFSNKNSRFSNLHAEAVYSLRAHYLFYGSVAMLGKPIGFRSILESELQQKGAEVSSTPEATA